MRIDCPHCGLRSNEEFTIKGEVPKARPDAEAGQDAYVDYVYIDKNTRGRNVEHWHHSGGCRAWLVVERNTITHEIYSVIDVQEAQ